MNDDQKVVSRTSSHGQNGPLSAVSVTPSSFLHPLAQKSQKLAAGTYLVTGLLKDTNPLALRLRQVSLIIMRRACTGEMSHKHEYTAKDLENNRHALHSSIAEALALLSVGLSSGLISDMNYEILSREYHALDAASENAFNGIKNPGIVFSDKFFDVSEPDRDGAENKNTFVFPPGVTDASSLASERTDGQISPAPKGQKGHSASPATLGRSRRHGGRRSAILALFVEKDAITVKDALRTIKNCSEKTLQREFGGMVEEGILRREGERRWSVYVKR